MADGTHLELKLERLGLHTMVSVLREQRNNPALQAMSFEDLLDILVSRQIADEDQRKFDRIIKQGGLKYVAWPQNIKCSTERNLQKPVVDSLLTCGWVDNHQNILITGMAGTGKTWLAHAFAVKAAMCGFSIQYKRASDLLLEFERAHGIGDIYDVFATLRKKRVLIIDDLGLALLSPMARQDLLMMIDDRYLTHSLIITSQLPVQKWHEAIGDPTFADAIMDRLSFISHKVELKGDSQRAIYDSIELNGSAHA